MGLTDDLEQLELNIDRELVRRDGLHAFTRLAWPKVEPGIEFQDNWHIGAVCEHLQAVTQNEIQNLLILQPPSTTKSILVGTMWPAWDWIVDARTRFIFSSYGQSLSEKNARMHRDLVLHPWFRARWGDRVTIARDSVTKVKEFENTARGFRFSTSVGGEVTGRHGNRLVFDDLVKAQDAEGRPVVTDKDALHKANTFWFKTMGSREADPRTTKRVGVMQRLHGEDAAAKCEETGRYTILRLPMEYERKYHCHTSWARRDGSVATFDDPRTEEGELLQPDRFDADKVQQLKEDLGPTAYAAQEQQRPTQIGGNIFKEEWFQYWNPAALPEQWPTLIQSWDMSFKKTSTADYVCGQVWGVYKANLYLLDMVWARMSLTETIDAVRALSQNWPRAYTKIVEDAANGPGVCDILQDEIMGLELVRPEGGKEARAYACEPFWARRSVWLPPNHSQLEELKKQHAGFPRVTHDDAVDAGTQAVLYLARGIKTTVEEYRRSAKSTRGPGVTARDLTRIW